MPKIISFFLLWPLFFCGSVFSQSQLEEYELNPDHSQISFEVDYLKVSSVQGYFQEFTGEALLNEKLIVQKASLSIQADSITTHDAKRDTHLKKRDFLAVANYPTISFESSAPAKMNGPRGTLTGELNFLGEKHPIVLELELLGPQVDPWGKEHVFYRMTAQLDRKELGIHWNKVLDQGGLLVGEKIDIKATLQLQPKGEKTSFSTHMVPGAPSGGERQVLPKKSLEEIKNQYPEEEPDDLAAPQIKTSHPKSKSQTQTNLRPEVTAWQWFQVGVLSFFALFGVICMGVGLKYVVEKNMPYGRFQHLAEALFILLVFALSACLYTLMRLLLETA